MSRAEAPHPCVLLVVHRPHLRDRLRAAIEERELSAVAVATAREALEALDGGDLAAAVIDQSLPTDGCELARRVRAHAEGGDLPLALLAQGRWAADVKAVTIAELRLLDVVEPPVDASRVAELLFKEIARHAPDPPAEPLADAASQHEQRQVEQQARAAQREQLMLRGSLAQRPFPQLLHQLYRARAEGALFLLRGKTKKIVFFSDGHPTYVKSNVLAECLGNVLVREGMITAEECAESIRQMRAQGRQQGTVLIEMGAISPQNLVAGLEMQLRSKLLSVFRWTDGEYMFKPDARPADQVVRLEMSNAALIAEGIRHGWSAERVREQLAAQLERYPAPATDPELRFQELPLDELEQTLLESVDGRQTLEQLIERSPLSAERAAVVASMLLVTGVVETRGEPAAAPAISDEPPEEEQQRARLAQELLSLRSRDVFGVLGVSVGSSDEEVERAYSTLARRFHPDRYRRYSAETRQVVREIFGVIYDAYREIAAGESRRGYGRRFSTNKLNVLSDAMRRSLRAEERAQQARGLIAEERWDEARELLEQAVELCADAGDLRALLGWVTFRAEPDDPSQTREAIRQLRAAIELDPTDEHSYIYLGRVYARIGRTILAEKQFEKAVQCNPMSAEALEQLRLSKEARRAQRTTSRRRR